MGKFQITKKLELDQYSKGAYLIFSLLTFKEIKSLAGLNITQETTKPEDIEKALNKVTEILQSKFIDGKLPDKTKELIPVTKADLGDLPIEILGDAMGFLSGGQKKA